MTAQHPTERSQDAGRRRRRSLVPLLRITTGLILFTFAATHFLNHALGLISLDAMQNGQELRTLVTRSLPGTVILLSAALIHLSLGLAKFLTVRTWRIGAGNAIQLMFGLLIPIFLTGHVLGTRGVHEMFGTDDTYSFVLRSLWPGYALNQAILMVLVWVHGCFGVHNWLSLRPWYRRSVWLWYGLAVAIPALGYAGFVTASRTLLLGSSVWYPMAAEKLARVEEAKHDTSFLYIVILGSAILIWVFLFVADRLGQKFVVTYANGPRIRAPRGLSLLAISRINGVPHASVCGGRARCSTCRVRVIKGLEGQTPASETEQAVLNRIGAPRNVRLACQLYPTADLTVSTLLPALSNPGTNAQTDRYHWGIEQEVTILFCDLRGYTRMSEGRLSFDTVFIMNQFLGRMAEAIEDDGGYVDKFMGDGIMAIFGMDGPVRDGAANALAAARAMGGVLRSLNQTLRDELPTPLSIGIGIHTGPAILGRIGADHRTEAAARITALGDTVNLASRLETRTKDLGAEVIVSKATLAAAGHDVGNGIALQSIDIRGLSEPVIIHALARVADLLPEPEAMPAEPAGLPAQN